MQTTDRTGDAGRRRVHPNLRRGLAGVFVTCALGGAAAAALVGPSASAAPDPCLASEVAKTIGSVATSTGEYLEDNPQTNMVLTAASKQQGPQAIATLKTYFDAHPEVGEEMQELQSPLTDLAGQCELPITLPQVLQLMQAASQAQNAGTLPGAQQVAEAVPGLAAEVPVGTGPLPGPAATTAGTTPATSSTTSGT